VGYLHNLTDTSKNYLKVPQDKKIGLILFAKIVSYNKICWIVQIDLKGVLQSVTELSLSQVTRVNNYIPRSQFNDFDFYNYHAVFVTG
jgi:hypothetical protein